MLEIASKKITDKRTKFIKGSFEKIPLKTKSVDKIISTLALHWVESIDSSIKELKRVLKPNGSINVLMIESNDGKEFKKLIFKVMKKYLSKKQIFNAAKLINRITKKELRKNINIKNTKDLIRTVRSSGYSLDLIK